MKGAEVFAVTKNSIAEEIGIECGDVILNINGNDIEDELDYRFYSADDYIEMTVLKKSGEKIIFELECDEPLGIEFEDALMGGARSCRNKCIFCFIDQLPKGMRETLYFKDDDARLSFLTGNYITLTNLSEHDIEKIIKMHLEPINISVHTTNPALRCKMLNNKNAGTSLDIIKRFYDAGIHLNGQIVLVKGVNDGDELSKTIEDLSAYYPYMTSVSVVPVGITDHREGLYPLTPFSTEDATAVLKTVDEWQKKLLHKCGTRFIYAADEFYIKAEKEFPSDEESEGYYQIENGVGLTTNLNTEFFDAMEGGTLSAPKKVNLVTGAAAYDNLVYLMNAAMERHPLLKARVYKIINRFFGENITVAGLLTGGDIISQLEGEKIEGDLLIPEVMLRSGSDVFLDDITIPDVEEKLGVKIRVVKCSGYDLWDEISQ